MAWDSFGHMVVASIAYRNLDSQTQRSCQPTIQNPYYKTTWAKLHRQAIKGDDRKRMIFMLAPLGGRDQGDNKYHNDGGGGGTCRPVRGETEYRIR